MAADTNVVALVGRLTRDAEQRQAGETTIQSMRLAFTTRAKKAGEWVDESNFIDVTLFGREGLGRYLVKGTRIGITGRLSWHEWQTSSGDKRQQIEVIANDVQLLDSKAEGSAPADLPVASAPPRNDDSDIPFAMSAV